VAFRRRGVENEAGATGQWHHRMTDRNGDPTLIKAIAPPGRAWFEELAGRNARDRCGSWPSATAITPSLLVRRLVDLAFLSPELVEAILHGPATRRTHCDASLPNSILPLDWTDQPQACSLTGERPSIECVQAKAWALLVEGL